MKKVFKRTLYIFIGIFAFLLISIFTIPVFFKDTIKEKINKEIEKNVEAKVYFDADKFGLSMISNFPDFTVSLGDFGVVGKKPFSGDTLVDVKEFRIVVDIMSVISGDKITVKEISLNKPSIYAQVLKNGKANWDIYKSNGNGKEEPEHNPDTSSSSQFSMGIDKWRINQGNIIYHDKTMPLHTHITDLNHQGQGDFTQDVLDLKTITDIKNIYLRFDSVTYLNNNTFHADMVMNLNLLKSKYTFKQNEFQINDFGFGFDGFIAMPDSNIQMDLTYKTKENAFKSILSLVPGIYTESFKDLESSGKLSFNGFVKGIYSSDQYPQFGLNLDIKEGMFQYPDLPSSVHDVNLNLKVDNDDGIIDSTRINLKRLEMKLGENPVQARMLLKRLDIYDLEAFLKAELNLEDLNKVLPLEGMTVKGMLSTKAKALGVYSENQLPKIKANVNLKNGFFSTKEVPAAIENVNLRSKIVNNTGMMKDMAFYLEQFAMLLDGEKFTARGSVVNFNDYTYDMNVNGNINLEKVMNLYPIEGMKLSGNILTDITAAGKMSQIENEAYDKLSTKGSFKVKDLVYTSEDQSQDVKIDNAILNFTPTTLNLKEYQGYIGNSDISLSGSISNYMAYIFKDHTIFGEMNFNSKQFDVNEWIEEDEGEKASTEATSEDTSSTDEEYGVVEIPKNIDFKLAANMDKVIYGNMNMENVKGDIRIKDGILNLKGLNFDMLDGHFVTNGEYNTQIPDQPKYAFDLNIKNLSIPKSYETFTTVKKFAPAAEKMKGQVSSDFSIQGLLGQDMMPVYNTMSGQGIIEIADATYSDSKLLNGIANTTKMDNLKTLRIQDTKIQAEIRDGKVFVEPFNINAGNTKMKIFGNNSLDGTMDYNIAVNMPAGKAGNMASNALSSLSGVDLGSVNRINLDLQATGPNTNPKIKVVGASVDKGKGGIKDAVQEKAKKEFDKKKKEAEQKAREKAEKMKKEAEQKARQEAQKAKEKAKKKAEQKAKEKASEQTKEKAKDKAKDLKDQFGF